MNVTNIETIYPVTPVQEALLPASVAVHRPGARLTCEFRGQLDFAAFADAWKQLMARYAVLRSRFVWKRIDKPVQVVLKDLEPAINRVDLRDYSITQQQEQWKALTSLEGERGFDPSAPPLWRLQLCQTEDDVHWFAFLCDPLILDEQSMRSLFIESLTLYRGNRNGERVQLETRPSFQNYVGWLRQQPSTERSPIELFNGFPDIPSQELESIGKRSEQQIKLATSATSALQSFSLRNGLSIETVILGAWSIVLSRYANSDKIICGVRHSGRTVNFGNAGAVIGPLANTLPLPVQLSYEEEITHWLTKLQVQVEELTRPALQNEPSTNEPEFDTCFVLQSDDTIDWPTDVDGKLKIDKIEISSHRNYSIVVRIAALDEVRVCLEYNEERYSAAAVNVLLKQLRAVLDQIAGSRKKLGELSLLSENARARITGQYKESRRDFPLDKSIHQLFAEQASATPNAIALSYEGQELTYRELNERANQLGHYLQSFGVGPDVLVGLCIEPSLDLLVGLLGIMKAGGAYLPLDPGYPPARLGLMIEDSQIPVLVTKERWADDLPVEWRQVVCLDSEWEAISEQSSEAPESDLSRQNLAYVIYTSGSTGRPKGVMITHGNLVNYISWAGERYLSAGERPDFALYTSLAFDLTVTSLFLPLVNGLRLVLYEGEDGVETLRGIVGSAGEWILKATPSHLGMLGGGDYERSRVRKLIVGGEALRTKLAATMQESLGAATEIINEYGPTEATVGCMHYGYVGAEGRAEVSIGRGISNVQVYVLDERQELVGEQVRGELYIGGAGVGRGYLGRAELTAERFIPDEYSGEAGARLYRTGDMARYLADGNIEYLGRVDEQVKVRGYRIELGEIESILMKHPAVDRAAVAIEDDESGSKQLVAYLVPKRKHAFRQNGQKVYQLPNGLSVNHLNKNETDMLYDEIFEHESYLRHGITIEKGDCLFDVGANIGLFTLFAYNRATDLKIYAFEPIPQAFEQLEANVRLYGCEARLFQCGLSNEDKTAQFTFYPKTTVMSGLYADVQEDEHLSRAFLSNQSEQLAAFADELMAGRFEVETFACELKTISAVIAEQNVEQIDLLKIDVEKSEADVLLGIKDADWKKIKQLVVEVHDLDGRLNTITDLLRTHGYEFVVEQDLWLENTELYNIYAVHPSRKNGKAASADGANLLLANLEASDLSVSDLRKFLMTHLPEYMIPTSFVELGEMPLTASGKLDRQRLAAVGAERLGPDSKFVAPSKPTEELLCGLWAEVLKVERVGIDDNFFELGGHSLLATQVVSRVRETFGVELLLRSLFETPTVRGLAVVVDESLRSGMSAAGGRIERAERTGELPLSFAQQRLWFLDQLEPGNPFYSVPSAVRLTGRLDIGALQRAFSEVVRRHEVLRTSFPQVNGAPVQRIQEWKPLTLPLVDLRSLRATEREAETRRLTKTEAQRGFDLSTGPLLRVSLLRLDDTEHIVLLTMHHIVSDGWSIGVLVKELATLYRTIAQGGAASLPDLPIQYADYSVWQRNWLQGPVLDQQLAYWKTQLADAAALLELPMVRPRPAIQSFRGATHSFGLDDEVSDGLRQLSRQQGATLFMTLLAAFQVLLQRYTGQSDIVVGSPIAGRNRIESEGLIGFFVNQLVLRGDLLGNPTFKELLSRVRHVCLDAYLNQDIPFEKLVEELHPERNLSHAPVFQISFSLETPSQDRLELPGLSLTVLPVETGTAKFDLSLSLVETGAGLRGTVEYDRDLLEAASVQRLMDHYELLLQGIVKEPERRLWELELLGATERQELLAQGAGAVAPEVRESLAMLFAQQVKARPEATAVVYEAERLSYRELDERGNQVAQRLRRMGVGAETIVGLCLPRSLEMIVGLLGIVKAGGAYLPLDGSYPEERLRYMVADAGARVVLTSAAERERVAQWGVETLCLDQWEEFGGESVSAPASETTAANLAYVIYTSGSTGKPKGVQVEQRSLINHSQAIAQAYDLRVTDRVLQFTSLSFDVAAEEIFPSLLHGAAVVLNSAGSSASMTDFLKFIDDADITVLNLPSPFWHELVSELSVSHRTLPESLRLVIAGSDSVLPEKLSRWHELVGQRIEWRNAYGPSEATITTTIYQPPAEFALHSVPIGRPITNTRIHVLDQALKPLPVGVRGELYIGGAGLARGYTQPDLTAERFIPDPYSPAAGARLYRTGDLGRLLPDGNIEFAGRVDQQIKLRGYRIELSEVEAALKSETGVAEAVVLLKEERLVAYLVAQDENVSLNATSLRASLKEKLPEYMIPTSFVELEEMPLTTSGKLDRQRLAAVGAERLGPDSKFVAPSRPTEELLCGLWAEVLKVERVGIDDNFFELGGHSLLATQVVSRVRETFGVELLLRSLFETPTVRGLAVVVDESLRSGTSAAGGRIERAERTGELPLSFAQQRLWFLDQLEPGNPFYSVPSAVRLTGRLDIGALQRAFSEVVRRHEVLRTSFPQVNGAPVQRIQEWKPLTLPLVDLRSLRANERENAARRAMIIEAGKPFDLSTGPLLRLCLFQLDDAEHLLLTIMHHIVSDEWSMAVLVQELRALYGSFSNGEPSSLPELAIQYADYAVWQRRWHERGALEEQLDYWKQQLSGAPSRLSLPADRQPGPIRNYNGEHILLNFSSDVTRSIRALSLSAGTTLFMTMLAAFYALLYRRTHQEDIVVGTDVANRNYGQTEKLIGFFVNMLVLRANLHSDLTFHELLRQVRETALQAYAHQDLPFDELVRHLEKRRDARANPLFDVVFVLQNTPSQELAFPGLSFQPFRIDNGIVHFDLVLQINEVGDELVGTLSYRTDMFAEATAARLARDYEAVLASITANPNQRLSELQFLTADESGGLTAADFPKARMSQKEFEDVLAAMSKSASKTV